MTGRTDQERTPALFELYTGAVADILDDLGPREQCLRTDLRPLVPTTKVGGPVFTVRGRSHAFDDGKDPRYVQVDMLEAQTEKARKTGLSDRLEAAILPPCRIHPSSALSAVLIRA